MQKHILIVDDNDINRIVLNKLMHKLGFENIKMAINGKEAIDLVDTEDFDLILMDCQMPVMDGFEATTHIRALNNHKAKTPIIAVTANVLDEYKKRCEDVGMNDFIGKPVSIDILKETVFKWL